jgi:hypothetical protein
MSRGLTSPNATAAAASHVRPITFILLQFDAATLYFHTGVGTYTWGSQTWLGIGALGSMSNVEETDAMSPYRVSYQLSGINDDILAQALGEQIYKRLVIRYEGFLDENGALVDTPHELRRDFMDTMEIARGGEIETITLHCESEMIRDTKAPGRMFSDEDQQVAFASDTGFQYLPQMIDAAPHWGPGGDPVKGGMIGPGTTYDDWGPPSGPVLP